MSRAGFLVFGIAWLLAASAVPARTGIVRTRAGGTYQGEVTLSPRDHGVLVALAGGGLALVPIIDLASAGFEAGSNVPALPFDRWIVFRNSAMPVPVAILAATPTELQLDSGRAKFKVATLDVAGILFQPGDPSLFPALPAGRPGVVLRNGDFIDGEFFGFDGSQVLVSTVLFGIRRLVIHKEAVAVVLHALPPQGARYQVRSAAGRVFCSSTPPTVLDADRLLVVDPVQGATRLQFDDVLEIRTAPQ